MIIIDVFLYSLRHFLSGVNRLLRNSLDFLFDRGNKAEEEEGITVLSELSLAAESIFCCDFSAASYCSSNGGECRRQVALMKALSRGDGSNQTATLHFISALRISPLVIDVAGIPDKAIHLILPSKLNVQA